MGLLLFWINEMSFLILLSTILFDAGDRVNIFLFVGIN